MAISEVAGSAVSSALSASQATGAQRAAQQTLQSSTQAGDDANGATGLSVAGAAQSVSAGGEGTSSGDATRGTKLDITV